MFLSLIIMQFVLAQLHSISWRHSEMVPIDVQGLTPPFPLDQFSVSLSSSHPGSRSGECSPCAKGRLMLENFFCEQNASELVFVSDSNTADKSEFIQSFLHLILWSQHPTTFTFLNKKGETSYILLGCIYLCVCFAWDFFLVLQTKTPKQYF